MNTIYKTWRFLDTGTGSAMFVLALDEAIMAAVGAGDVPPTVRLYGFDPLAISVGYGQRPEDILNVDACRSAGIDIARRSTGGRAVLHDDEITYSVIGRSDDPVFGGSINDTYRSIGQILCTALRALGIAAALKRGTTGRHPGAAGRTAPCFMSTSRSEITVHGRKLVGSAQRRRQGIFLQHGSILIGPGHRRIVEFFRGCANVEPHGHQYWDSVTDCRSECAGHFDPDKLKVSLRAAFEGTLNGAIIGGTLSAEELSLAQRYMNERSALKGW